MVKEAEKYAEEDKKKKELVETVNEANTLVYATEKSLKEYGDKISAGDKTNIEAEMDKLKKAIESKDVAAIKSAQESLAKVSQKLGEEVYKASQQAEQTAGAGAAGAAGQGSAAAGGAQPGGGQSSSAGGDKDDVIDADFKAEDDK